MHHCYLDILLFSIDSCISQINHLSQLKKIKIKYKTGKMNFFFNLPRFLGKNPQQRTIFF